MAVFIVAGLAMVSAIVTLILVNRPGHSQRSTAIGACVSGALAVATVILGFVIE